MMIRIRSNVGTWKVDASSSTMTIQDLVQSETRFQPWKIIKPFSLDPSGARQLKTNTPLHQQGLQHGSMIYCRLEEKTTEEQIITTKDDTSNNKDFVVGSSLSSSLQELHSTNLVTSASASMNTKAAAAADSAFSSMLQPISANSKKKVLSTVTSSTSSSASSTSKQNHSHDVVDLFDSSDEEEAAALPTIFKDRKRPATKKSLQDKTSQGLRGGSNQDDAIVLDNDIDDDDSDDEDLKLAIALSLRSSRGDGDAPSSKQQQPTTKRSSPSRSSKAATPSRTAPDRSTRKRAKVAASTSTESTDPPQRFQICSYNIWFGPNDATVNGLYPRERMTAIVNAIRQSQQHQQFFLGFQEVTAQLKSYLQPLLAQEGFKWITQPGIEGFYGVSLAIPNSLPVVEANFVPYKQTTQGRGLLYVKTQHILYATTHLESFVNAQTYTGVRQREMQIMEAVNFCQQQLYSNPDMQIAIIAGDFNWDDERKRKTSEAPNRPLTDLVLSKTWKDAGTPHDYTYDPKENPMLGGNLRRRFDRCIYLSKSETPAAASSTIANVGYQATSLTKIGKEAIPNLTWNKLNTYNGSRKIMPGMLKDKMKEWSSLINVLLLYKKNFPDLSNQKSIFCYPLFYRIKPLMYFKKLHQVIILVLLSISKGRIAK